VIKVVNKRSYKPTESDFYIGRGSVLGNKYYHGNSSFNVVKVESREEAIRLYEVWLRQKIKEKDKDICGELNYILRAARKENVQLICYCAPLSCHGDIIKKVIEEKLC
jgi:Domain of unknown function (DUF4326)